MIKLILNSILSKSKAFEEPRISEGKTLVHKYSYNKDKARYIFARTFIKGDKVLDSACGEGRGSFILSQGNQSSVYGLDLSDKALSFAKAKFGDKNLIFYKGDVYDTGFENNFFTSVVSIETIEHLSDQDKFLRELRRILKKDGVLVISSPDKIIKDKFFDNPHHINLLYKDDMRGLLKKYFDVSAVYCQTPFMTKHSFMLYLTLIFSSIFFSAKIVKDRPYLTGTNCIFICKGKS